MSTEESTKKKAAKTKPASRAAEKPKASRAVGKPKASRAAPKKSEGEASGAAAESAPRASGPTGRQSLALWEMILKGDGTVASDRSVRLKRPEIKDLVSAGMITTTPGRQKKKPTNGEKVYLTDAAWEWANRDGLSCRLLRSPIAASLMEILLSKVGGYLEVHELALDHLLRPRRSEVETEDATENLATMEQRIRAAYLRVTKGALNQYVRLSALRAELPGEHADAVDTELRAMQQRGDAVLYPIDDPQDIQPEDTAAAMQVSGERRDLLCIME